MVSILQPGEYSSAKLFKKDILRVKLDIAPFLEEEKQGMPWNAWKFKNDT